MDQGVGQELQTAQLDGGSDLSRPSALPLSTGNAAVRWLAAGTETQKLYAVPLARNLHRQACASGGPELARSQLLLCAKCEREARGRRGPRAHGRLRRRRYPRMLSVERERADLSPGTRKRKRGTVRPTPGRRERNVAIAVVRLGTARIVKALVREMRFCFEHALPTALRRRTRLLDLKGASGDNAALHGEVPAVAAHRDVTGVMRDVRLNEVWIGNHVAVEKDQQRTFGCANGMVPRRPRSSIPFGTTPPAQLKPIAEAQHDRPDAPRTGLRAHDHLEIRRCLRRNSSLSAPSGRPAPIPTEPRRRPPARSRKRRARLSWGCEIRPDPYLNDNEPIRPGLLSHVDRHTYAM